MRTFVELQTSDTPFSQDDVNNLIENFNSHKSLKDISAKIKLPTLKIGELASFDPATLQLIIEIANVGALGVAVKGFFDFLIEWQKNRSQKITIKIGEVSLEIPANASHDQIFQLSEKVMRLAKELQDAQNKKKR